jgi:hypothetical protein
MNAKDEIRTRYDQILNNTRQIPQIFRQIGYVDDEELLDLLQEERDTLDDQRRWGGIAEICIFASIVEKNVRVFYQDANFNKSLEMSIGNLEGDTNTIDLLRRQIIDGDGNIVYHYSLLVKI